MNSESSENSINSAAGPLRGVRVLDFCSFINGALSAMLLGDLGAEVIKVEPLTGDLARAWGPFIAGESRFFLSWNRNKRGLAIDLTKPKGRDVIYDLVRNADVMLENFRPGIAEKLRIDYDTVRLHNPQLIYCASSAFGSVGPDARRPGYDPVLQSLAGAAKDNARFGGRTAICSVAIADYQAALLVMNGVLAALFHRERTGEGQKVETSLLQAIMTAEAQYLCKSLDKQEDHLLGIFPYQLFEAADDWLFIGAATDKFWRILCDALGASELGADPNYATNPKRVTHRALLNETLQPIFRRRTAAEWEALLIERGVPCGRVMSYDEFMEEPQVAAMQMNAVVEHPVAGQVRMAGIPIHFQKTPGRIQRAAPMLGQHTAEILMELGYDESLIEKLKQAGAIAND